MGRKDQKHGPAAIHSFKRGLTILLPNPDIAVLHPASDARGLQCFAGLVCRSRVLAREGNENIERHCRAVCSPKFDPARVADITTFRTVGALPGAKPPQADRQASTEPTGKPFTGLARQASPHLE